MCCQQTVLVYVGIAGFHHYDLVEDDSKEENDKKKKNKTKNSAKGYVAPKQTQTVGSMREWLQMLTDG